MKKQLGKFWLEIGWYSGNQWCLLKLQLFDTFAGYPTGIDFIVIFGIQILKFSIDVGYDVM